MHSIIYRLVLGASSAAAGSIDAEPGRCARGTAVLVLTMRSDATTASKFREGDELADLLDRATREDLYGSFYRHPADVEELIDALGLAEKRRNFYRSLSGGQRQRLSIALALIGRPKIAMLDEMTTGLDPQAQRDTWELIEGVRARGVTIVMVTHFMEEAELLCDRVALLVRGRVVALDSPAGLAALARDAKRVRFVASAPFEDRLLTQLPEVATVARNGSEVIVTGTGELVNVVILTLAAAGVSARDVQLDCSTLEDALVKLTGRHGNEPDSPA